jgi:hypothetical protein
MQSNYLKVYHGPQADTVEIDRTSTDSVSISLGQIFPLLAEAVQSNRTWLQDFSDDEVTISTDLYEVILAYQHFRRPSAWSHQIIAKFAKPGALKALGFFDRGIQYPQEIRKLLRQQRLLSVLAVYYEKMHAMVQTNKSTGWYLVF